MSGINENDFRLSRKLSVELQEKLIGIFGLIKLSRNLASLYSGVLIIEITGLSG